MSDGHPVPVRTAKATFADLVRRAEAGERILISRHGEVVAELGPVTAQGLTGATLAPGTASASIAGSAGAAAEQERQRTIDTILSRSRSGKRGLRDG